MGAPLAARDHAEEEPGIALPYRARAMRYGALVMTRSSLAWVLHTVSVGRRPLALALICALLAGSASVAVAGAPVKNGSYSGVTSEKGLVSFKVSANGKRILSFSTAVGYNGKCGQGGGPGFEIKVSSISIHARGKFAVTVKGTLPGAAIHVSPITVKLSGRISGKHASGTVAQTGDHPCTTTNVGANPYSETFTATAA
jgi:hypothetical protein